MTRARLVLSTFLSTSFATIYEPIFECFAKKTMTLSLATLIRIFALLALVTVSEMNWPIMRCKSKADMCVARDPTMNLSKFKASRYTSVFSSFRSSLSNIYIGSTSSLAAADDIVAIFF